MPPLRRLDVFLAKITDSSGKSINGASVILMQQKFDSATKKKKDVLLKAMTTKANGEFNLEDLPVMGALTLKIIRNRVHSCQPAHQFPT